MSTRCEICRCLVAAMLLLVVAPNLAFAHGAKATPELVVPDNQKAIIARAHEALAGLATKSARAEALLTLYDKYAVLALTDADGTVRVVTSPAKPPYFFVAARARRESKPATNICGVFANFACYPTPVMMLRNYEHVPPIILGTMFAHELSHAEDCLLKGEPESEELSDDWLLGELHAHETVATLLKDVTGGKWDSLVSTSRAERQQLAIGQGKPPGAIVFGHSHADGERIRTLFGQLEPVSEGLLFAQLEIEANIRTVEAQMTGDGQVGPAFAATAQARKLDVARGLYQLHMGTPPKGNGLRKQ